MGFYLVLIWFPLIEINTIHNFGSSRNFAHESFRICSSSIIIKYRDGLYLLRYRVQKGAKILIGRIVSIVNEQILEVSSKNIDPSPDLKL